MASKNCQPQRASRPRSISSEPTSGGVILCVRSMGGGLFFEVHMSATSPAKLGRDLQLWAEALLDTAVDRDD